MLSFLLVLSLVVSMIGCQNEVKEQDVTKVFLSDNSLTLELGDTYKLDVNVTPNSSEPLIWSSSNNDIASVFYGKVTAKAGGIAIIKAECNGSVDSCIVTVTTPIIEEEDIPNNIGDYRLVWSDEFNANVLNANVWNIEVNGNGGGNNELQYYRAENVSVGSEPSTGKGCLILTARKENYAGKNATSGRITSQNNVTFTHGMIEASIKMPHTANGLWPAFWMMGNDISTVGWPACGEIDILEMGHATGIANGTQDRYFNGA